MQPFLYVADTASAAARLEASLDLTFLVLGGPAPVVPGAVFRDNSAGVELSCAGVVLTGPVAAEQLSAVLQDVPDPALPILDFAANEGLRCDFRGGQLDPAAFAELRRQLAPVWRRLAELPFRAAREERADMTVLRLAYSRNTAIEARFAPNSPVIVNYPLLGSATAARQRLEFLAGLDLLRRRAFTRTHACGKCGSARLHVYEACPSCGGVDLSEEQTIHHYRCGWQEPESRFVSGRLLVCPKCRRELRHFGVDYGKPGTVIVCRGCGAANAEPVAHFACLDCAAVTPTSEATATDWHHYDLTDDAIRALREGRLPRLDVGTLLEGRNRAFPVRDFRLLAAECVRVAQRYKRPFALAQLSIANMEALRHTLGPAGVDVGFRLAVDVIVESLRDSDFVTASGPASVLIGFPETTVPDVERVMDRLTRRIKATVSAPFELTASVVEGDRLDTLIPQD